jgi:hypothetical protein
MSLDEEYPKTFRKQSAKLSQLLDRDKQLGDESREEIGESVNCMAELATDLVDIVNRLVGEHHTSAEIGELLIAFELTTEQLRGHSDAINGKLYEIGDRLKAVKPAKKVKRVS